MVRGRPKGGLPSWASSNTAIGYCEAHGKQLYASRESAKSVIKQMREPGMRAYPCETHDGHWHIGHLPRAVRHGDGGGL